MLWVIYFIQELEYEKIQKKNIKFFFIQNFEIIFPKLNEQTTDEKFEFSKFQKIEISENFCYFQNRCFFHFLENFGILKIIDVLKLNIRKKC